MTTISERPEAWPPEDDRSFEELVERQGVTPVRELAELARPDLWESNEKYDAFLVDLYASRRAGTA